MTIQHLRTTLILMINETHALLKGANELRDKADGYVSEMPEKYETLRRLLEELEAKLKEAVLEVGEL